MGKKFHCPYCDKSFERVDLIRHIDDAHAEMIPEGYTATRIAFNIINYKSVTHDGRCVICGKPTKWNEEKGRYDRICELPACKKKYIETVEANMLKTRGVKRITQTVEGQEKMLANRKISGVYKFSDGYTKTYTGKYEYKALEFLDKVMHCRSEDIVTPGPTISYLYNGQEHWYISDIFYIPYNLIIEVKDGGDNPNNRPMQSYREKQLAKEKHIIENTNYNYLRLTNNDFSQIMSAFADLKLQLVEKTGERVIKINENMFSTIQSMMPMHSDNDVIVVNYLQKNTFDNTSKLAIADNIKFDNVFYRNKEGVLKHTDKTMLEYCMYDTYVVRDCKDKILPVIKDNLDQFISEGFLYETLFNKKYYTIDQIKFEPLAESIKDFYDYTDKVNSAIRSYILGTTSQSDSILKENECVDIERMDNSFCDYSEDIPQVTPWFTPDEMKDLLDTEVDPYAILGTNVLEYNAKIRNAMNKLSESGYVSEDDDNYKAVLKLGWNPSIPYTAESRAYARQRQIRWFNENKPTAIIDISSDDFLTLEEATDPNTGKLFDNIIPVFISLLRYDGIVSDTIRKVTSSNWSHVALSFDYTLKRMYSFNAKDPEGNNGFSIEGIDYYTKKNNPIIKVLVFFITANAKKKLQKVLDYYIENRGNTEYSFKNIGLILLNKAQQQMYSLNMICSQFVDSCLKSINIDITNKISNLVVPGDFDRNIKQYRIFNVFEGNISSYKPKMILNKLKAIVNKTLNFKKLFISSIKEEYRVNIAETAQTDQIVNEIIELLTPYPIIQEAAKKASFEDNLDNEYAESHELIMSYSDSNIEGMKNELCRLYAIINNIEYKIKKMNDNKTPEYNTFITIRSDAIKDFNTAFKKIIKLEPFFNFEYYMKRSEYNKLIKKLSVGRNEFLYSGDIIAKIRKAPEMF